MKSHMNAEYATGLQTRSMTTGHVLLIEMRPVLQDVCSRLQWMLSLPQIIRGFFDYFWPYLLSFDIGSGLRNEDYQRVLH